jgi:hypothetical protein
MALAQHCRYAPLLDVACTQEKILSKRKIHRRSQRPDGLRRGSAAERLLGSWVRIPPEGMDVCLLYSVCVAR